MKFFAFLANLFKSDAAREAEAAAADEAAGRATEVRAFAHGTVLRVAARKGAAVAKGDELLVLDVSKMEARVLSPRGGIVQSVAVSQKDNVNVGDTLVIIG